MSRDRQILLALSMSCMVWRMQHTCNGASWLMVFARIYAARARAHHPLNAHVCAACDVDDEDDDATFFVAASPEKQISIVHMCALCVCCD